MNQSPANATTLTTPQISPSEQNLTYIQDPWSIEVLIKNAFLRTKSRLLSYILLQLLSSVVSSIVLVVMLAVGVLLVTGLIMAGQQIAAIIVGLLFFLFIVVVSVYVTSLFQFASIKTVITDETITDTLKSSWKLLYPYLMLTLWQGLFILGLLPLGVFTFFIVPVVWSVLFSFTNFILITSKKRDASILWISKDMFLSRFWDIVGRYILVTLLVSAVTGAIVALISFIVSLFGVGLVSAIASKDKEATQSSLAVLQTLVSLFSNSFGFITPLIVTPFYTAFLFEMYKLIPLADPPKKPKVWIGIAALSVVSMFTIFFYGYFVYALPDIVNVSQGAKNKSLELFQQQIQNYIQEATQRAQTYGK